MKKLVLVVPIVLLLAAGCTQTAVQTQTSITQNTNPIASSTSATNPTSMPPVPAQHNAPSTTKSNNCNNDDMACLIVHASDCQPTSVLISYSIPNSSIINLFTQQGQANFKIESSQNTNSCTLVYSVLSGKVSISDANRQILLNGGYSFMNRTLPAMTNAQIDDELDHSNSINPLSFNVPMTCTGSTNSIVSYLKDIQNHTNGNGTDIAVMMGTTSGSTYTNTTSSGQKLVCSQNP